MPQRATRLLTVATAFTAASLAAPALAATAPTPTSLTLKASRSTVAPNQREVITGTLKAGTKVLAGQPVKIEKRAAGAKSFTLVTTRKTDSKGHVAAVVAPGSKKGAKEQYELVFAGTSTYKASHSAIVTVTVS